MPNNDSSFADFTRSCDKLLTAVDEKAANLPSVAIHAAAMKQIFSQVKEVKARQDSLQAASRATTQELDAVVAQCREAAIRLRSVVKADIGPKSEELFHFGVAPLRPRKRRNTQAAKPTPEEAKAAAAAPAAEPAGAEMPSSEPSAAPNT